MLDHTITYDTPLEAVAKCALLSLDSTMKSNISVEPPIDLIMYEADSLTINHRLQLRLGAPYLAKIRKLWEKQCVRLLKLYPPLSGSPKPMMLKKIF